MSSDPAGSIRLTASPEALPGECIQCRGVPGDGVRKVLLDTGRYQEYHGQVYYCDICILEFVRLFNFIEPSEAAALRARVEELETSNFELTRQRDGLERSLHGLVDAGHCTDPSAHLHPAVMAASPVAAEADDIPAGDDAEPARVGEGDVESGAGASDEPGDDEGVDQLRSDGVNAGDFVLDL